MTTYLDLALVRDPETGEFDVAVENGDFVLDRTPVTPMVVALGTDARALPDDMLPAGMLAQDATEFGARRGWVGDAVSGNRLGDRFWLLVREKQLETVRLRAESYGLAAMSWFTERGIPFTVSAEWVARGRLQRTVRVEKYSIADRQTVAG